MSGTLKIGGKTLATHNSNTNIAKIQLGSADDVVLADSAGNSILTENGSVVTLNNVDTATIGSNALVIGSNQRAVFGSTSDGVLIYGAGGGSANKGRIDHYPSADDNYAIAFYNAAGSFIGNVFCTSSSTAFNTSSDYRLKENINDITDGITRVKQLNPSRFNFIADPDRTVDGFIAHEVSNIVPEAISGGKDAVHEDGSIDPQGIDQSKLVPLLTAALQESIALIESQQSQINALTTRIEALEAT